MNPPPPQRDNLETIAPYAWALYLGSSWTWIIGMVYPAYVLRDYGVWGFVAFAVPNVLGAAAMGFTLKDAQASQRMTEQHRPALRLFSEVTMAFHVFVVLWLGLRVFGEWFVLMLPPVAAALFMLDARLRKGAWLAAGLTTAISLGVIALSAATARAELALPSGPPALTELDLWLFLPASLFGFALCPYMDLTFHRARQSTTPSGGRTAFALGFVVVFCTMIVFTAAYSRAILPYLSFDHVLGAAPEPLIANTEQAQTRSLGPLANLLFAQLFIQIAFTLAIHLREHLRFGQTKAVPLRAFAALAIGAGLGVAALSPNVAGETVYRSILLLYGTALPGYVLLCVIPPIRRQRPCPKRLRAVWVVASVASYGFGWIGYVQHQAYGAIAAFVAIGLARIVVECLPNHEACSG